MEKVKVGVCLENVSLLCLAFRLFFLLAMAFTFGAYSTAPASILSWIEPQALFVSLLSVVFAKSVCEGWGYLCSLVSDFKVPSPSVNQPICCSPALSLRQQKQVKQTNDGFAHLFSDLRPVPTLARRVPTFAPFRNPAVTNRGPISKSSFSGFPRKTCRDQPCPSLKKLPKAIHSKRCSWQPKAGRVVSLSRALNHSQGPKGWISSRPTPSSGFSFKRCSVPAPCCETRTYLCFGARFRFLS
jgi:hypothetical protein